MAEMRAQTPTSCSRSKTSKTSSPHLPYNLRRRANTMSNKRKFKDGGDLEPPFFFKEHEVARQAASKRKVESKDDPMAQKPVIVIGGGIAGMCTAISVADQGRRVILLEELSDLGLCASSKSAGHIASNAMKKPKLHWAEFLQLGGHFHAEFSKKFDGMKNYGFRDCMVYYEDEKGRKDFFELSQSKMPMRYKFGRRKKPFKQLNSKCFIATLRKHIKSCELIDVRLNQRAEKLLLISCPGAKSECIGVEVIPSGSESDPQLIKGVVVIANGCWTNELFDSANYHIDQKTKDHVAMNGIKGTGMVWQLGPDSNLRSRALYVGADIKDESGMDSHRSEELYIRRSEHGVGQELYGCIYEGGECWYVGDGPNVSPNRNDEKEALFLAKVEEWTGITRAPDDVRTCYMPSTDKDTPIVGPIGCVNNLFVIAGLAWWGMTLGPAAGYIVSRFLVGETLEEVKGGLGSYDFDLETYMNHDVKPNENYVK